MAETSSSNSELPLKKRVRLLDDNFTAVMIRKKKRTKVAVSGTTKYKGVVAQENGHWGAQIYDNDKNNKDKREWLGTFKTNFEAAMAYDSATIKIPKPIRNFPLTEITQHEPEFQKDYTKEAVLNMIRDGSYPHKFRDFLDRRSHIVSNISQQGKDEEESNKCLPTQIFEKTLMPSDVGKLNRLVIPKKYAVKYFPYVRDDQNERKDGEEAVEVVFRERASERQWNFRYCYWTSSQSYVFTRGWKGFVKDKNLKEGDAVVFYTCDGQRNKFLMIDVRHSSGNRLEVPREVNNKFVHDNSDEVMKKKLQEETKTEEKKGGFMLFGVRIQ